MDFKLFGKKIARRLSIFKQNVVNKGHHKLTVMCVPHSHRKIFNFQISNFTVLFAICLLVGVVFVSAVSIKNYSGVRKKEKRLQADITTVALKRRIENLLKQIGALKGKVRDGLPAGGVSIPIPADVLKKNPGFKYDELLVQLAKITYVSDKLGKEVEIIKKHLNHFRRIAKNMPSIWPVFGGGFVTSGYGPRSSPFTGRAEFHTGIDVTSMPGTPIKAAADGVVVQSGYFGGYGFMVEIRHKYGYSSVYAHCMRLNTKVGQTVKRGEVISYMGRTGAATGYHVHFEVKLNGQHVNPKPFMSFDRLN
jgi:murein DD-endopeptidase MepM/ murein hydrolase activator NlpD